jgi:hypothetical protein
MYTDESHGLARRKVRPRIRMGRRELLFASDVRMSGPGNKEPGELQIARDGPGAVGQDRLALALVPPAVPSTHKATWTHRSPNLRVHSSHGSTTQVQAIQSQREGFIEHVAGRQGCAIRQYLAGTRTCSVRA